MKSAHNTVTNYRHTRSVSCPTHRTVAVGKLPGVVQLLFCYRLRRVDAKQDVVTDAGSEQRGLLRDVANLLAQQCRIQLANVHTVQRNAP